MSSLLIVNQRRPKPCIFFSLCRLAEWRTCGRGIRKLVSLCDDIVDLLFEGDERGASGVTKENATQEYVHATSPHDLLITFTERIGSILATKNSRPMYLSYLIGYHRPMIRMP